MPEIYGLLFVAAASGYYRENSPKYKVLFNQLLISYFSQWNQGRMKIGSLTSISAYYLNEIEWFPFAFF